MSNCNWPPIVPFDSREVPDYPINALPARLAEYASQVAESYQVPIDLPAQLCLAVIGASAAKLVEIELNQDWKEPINLYVAAVLPSGQRKSAVFREITKPIEWVENAKQHGQGQGPKRLLVDDVTPEQLGTLLACHSGRIAIMSAEGGVFDMMAGRYSGGIPNLDVYLKGHAGDTIRIDRKGNEPEIIRDPALSIALTIQPEILKAMALHPGFRGRGLLARFLYVYPKSLLGYRKITTTPVTGEARQYFYRLTKDLLEWRDRIETDHPRKPFRIQLSPEAESIFKTYRESIELRLAPEGNLSLIGDWGGKLSGAVARIAGILHIAETQRNAVDTPISENTMRNAIGIGDYLSQHALLAFDAMGIDPAIEGARRVLEWLTQNAKITFSEREVFQDTKGWFRRMAALRLAIAALEEHGHIQMAHMPHTSGPGRRPSQTYTVNPIIFSAAQSHPQNTQLIQQSGFAKIVKGLCGY